MTAAQLARVEAMAANVGLPDYNDLDRAALTALLAERAKLREALKDYVCESHLCTHKDCAEARAALGETA